MRVQATEQRKYVFVEIDTRNPLYQVDPDTGSLQPWAYDTRQEAEAMLSRLSRLPETGTRRPLNPEFVEIIGLDADNYAKYAEWNWARDPADVVAQCEKLRANRDRKEN